MPDPHHQTLDLQLLANFIHQLINPLNGVIGTLDNLIEGVVPASRREQRLRAVRAQLEHSVLLVRNLAYFSQSASTEGAASYVKDKKTCVVPQLVIEAALFFQEEGLSREIKIHLEDRVTQYAFPGVPNLFRQVMMNLFDNCIEYSDEGTQVLVKDRIQKTSKNLIVEVTATGPGVASDEREKIFDLGYRGIEARKRVASGTGLGLFICRRIIEDVHEGTIEAEYSQKTREMTFRIRLPEGFILRRRPS